MLDVLIRNTKAYNSSVVTMLCHKFYNCGSYSTDHTTVFNRVITIEDGCVIGGIGTAVIEFMAEHSYHATVIRLGIPDQYIEHGEPVELWAECGFDENGIITSV